MIALRIRRSCRVEKIHFQSVPGAYVVEKKGVVESAKIQQYTGHFPTEIQR